jgi:tetratricopeptide (TPR) repeat protein
MVLVLLSVVITAPINAQGEFQTSLPQGTHKVGFTQKVYFDPGRPPLAEQRKEFQSGRAVHLSTWYPASVKSGSKQMNFNEYVDFFDSMINPDAPTAASKKAGLKLINYYMSQIGGDTVLFNKNLPDLMKSPTNSYLNASYLPGEYPVLIYPEAPYLSSLLCEYLASHGYIVVCVSRFGNLNAEFEWQNVRGIETLVQDCQFALARVKERFKLNDPKIAAMGVGMNASAGLAWMMRSPKVGALVSLEGGILTGYEFDLIKKSPFYDVTAANKPMLVLHSPHESVDPGFIENYKYADRYMAFLPGMKEFYYLNYGVWENSIKDLLGPAPGDTKKGFEVVSQYTLQFLNATLKGSAEGQQFLDKTPAQAGIPDGIIKFSKKTALLIPPAKSDLDKIYATSGFDGLMKEVNKYINEDKHALSFDTMTAFGTDFIQSRAFEQCIQWSVTFQGSYPDAVTAYSIAGRCYLELGRKENALTMYSKALEILPFDDHLDESSKARMKTAIEQRIEQLRKS